LGDGGMVKVNKARDIGLEREVAIKRLRSDLHDDQAPQRFLQEARATGQLEHPNIPPIYEMGKDQDGNPYFALKLIRGLTLSEIIQKLDQGDPDLHDRFPFIRRLEVFQKVCEAVAYAHKRGILHRDIKPENIMIGEFGEVLLVDWGLAKDQKPLEANSNLTEVGTFVGTPMYAAPEQLCGENPNEACDVYSLGATLYEWLSLKQPYEETNMRALLTAVLTKTPKDPVFFYHKVQGRLPVEMCRLVMKAIAKEPSQRFPSVAAMLEEVNDILAGEIRPLCPCTTVKFGFHNVSRLIDNHPILVVLVILWLLYPAYALIWALYRLVTGAG
jgi:serine/threonine-protein kinase